MNNISDINDYFIGALADMDMTELHNIAGVDADKINEQAEELAAWLGLE